MSVVELSIWGPSDRLGLPRFLDEGLESPDELVEVFEEFEEEFLGIGMRKAELKKLRRSVAGINDQERRIKIAEDSLVDFVKETQRNIACANPRCGCGCGGLSCVAGIR